MLLVDHVARPGAKIVISGGGRCNFTNTGTVPDRFLSANPHFARSALAGYTPADFLALVEGYVAPEPPTFRLAGASGRTGLSMAVSDFHKKGMATDYDVVVADRLAEVLTGGEADLVDTVTEAQLLDLERAAFMASVKDQRTQARVVHMLQTGKPLRN